MRPVSWRAAAALWVALASNGCATSNWQNAVSARPSQLCPIREDALSPAKALTAIDLPARQDLPTGPLFYRVPVLFATDRSESCVLGSLVGFGPGRGRLQYGQVDAFIEKRSDSLVDARFEARWFGPDDLQFRRRPVVTSQAHWLSHVTGSRRLLLFVHGYNNSFQEAAERAARIALGTGFDGKVVIFSWPSRASTASYTVDEGSAEWGAADLSAVLESILVAEGVDEVILVAHSMGTRVLSHVLHERAKRGRPGGAIKQVVLAAADIDAQFFNRDFAPTLAATYPVTSYVSAKDRAVGTSRGLHYYPRLGQGYLPHPAEPIETIDVTGLHRSLGHSYIAEDGSVLADLRCLIIENRRAAQRGHLEAIDHGGARFWRLQGGRLAFDAKCQPAAAGK